MDAGNTSLATPKIKAIIFDCFGVLLGNTYKQHFAMLQQTDPNKAEELHSINRAGDLGILSREESARYMADILGIEPEQIIAEQDAGEVRNEELLTFIASLKTNYKLAMLSNINGRDRVAMRFLPGQLDALFDTVIASGDEGCVKPEPEIYEIAATRLGVLPGECVMIDDIREYCDGAEAVGMRSIQFISTQQCIADLNTLIDRGR